MSQPFVTTNPWRQLRAYTSARIAQGRAGNSLPTRELLAFQLDHARAQDAVHLPLDVHALSSELCARHKLQAPLSVRSQAKNRFEYLQRPDLGRRLNDESRGLIQNYCIGNTAKYDLAIVIADGLSSQAVQKNAAPMLDALLDALEKDTQAWQLAPITLAEQGRVAIGDDIGESFKAQAVVVFIGERPGLSSPDSLGIYLTWNPRPARTDAERNCISNVRPQGLAFSDAAQRLLYLLSEARRLQLSGVDLKDRTTNEVTSLQKSSDNFLVQQ